MTLVVLPNRGEFGLKLRYHVGGVHALEGPKIVYMEPGEEALYPSATALRLIPRADDDTRRGLDPRSASIDQHVKRDAREKDPQARFHRTTRNSPVRYFVPDPVVRRGISPEVVIAPRWRRYGASKNWEGWVPLSRSLERVFAAGVAESSDTRVECAAAWYHDRPLDASIEAMRNAKLVIATSSGLSLLALLCGTPLLLVTYRGLVAPGPVLDPQGRAMEPAYWPPKIKEYYDPMMQHTSPGSGMTLTLVNGWEDPERVAVTARALLSC